MLWFRDRAIKSRPSDFINEIDGLEIVMRIDCDRVDLSPRDRRTLIEAVSSDAFRATTSPARGAHNPTRRKIWGNDGYKKRNPLTHSHRLHGPSTHQYSNLGPLTHGPIICQLNYSRVHVGVHVGIHVGLHGSATCPPCTTSAPRVPHD